MSAQGSLAPLLRGLVALVIVAAVAALVVALTWRAAAPRIAENQRLLEQQQLTEVLPRVDFDNRLTETRMPLEGPAARTAGVDTAWIARRSTEAVGIILRVATTDGYSGRIVLLLGLTPGGELLGVRTVEHRETPGLGDAIDIERSDWIRQFAGRSLDEPAREDWTIGRDGGAFDGITGATITSRAVIRAVQRALLYFEREGATLMRTPAPTDIDPDAPHDTSQSADLNEPRT